MKHPIKQPKLSSGKQKLGKENDPLSEIRTSKLKPPLPVRPAPSNPLKRKISNDFPGSSDAGVKIIVRVRPLNKNEEEGEVVVQKTSGDSLTIQGQSFTFDSVADETFTQVDIFHLVGAPLVKNCLAGFNSSVFVYGQTGSGKTYTIWGPPNALFEDDLSSEQQGLTPRVFERLFSRIFEEQNKHADKKLTYQCHCSFLEIYNEQVTDLLDPAKGNLHIREDIKSGVYVENLTEKSVCSLKDVTHLLKKGLSNRRIGSTSINMESSRSHSVFTFVVESRCESMDGSSSTKISRINFVDLAGSERQKLTEAAGERLKESGNINRSLSQLGNVINILAEVSQNGKQRHIPYRDSKLTYLLQESLGGNAKLAMVCAISPAQSCQIETLMTLRFAMCAKVIKNKAVVNEQTEDDVKSLHEVIRQLKAELLRVKLNGTCDQDLGKPNDINPTIVQSEAIEKVHAKTIRQEMAFEDFCTRQNAEFMQLKRQMQQYINENKKQVDGVLVEEMNRLRAENKRLTDMLTVMSENYNELDKQLVDYMNKNPAPSDTTNSFKKRNIRVSSSSDGENPIQKQPKISKVCVPISTEPLDTDFLVEDGYQWKNNGHQVTKGNPYLRYYFRCSHAPSCPAKKKVQRSVEDQSILVAIYEEEHNHQASSGLNQPVGSTTLWSVTGSASVT